LGDAIIAHKIFVVQIFFSCIIRAMNTQHTPGPWAAGFDPDDDTYFVYALVDDVNDGLDIAHCYGPDELANARLMGAAPDLLEALQGLLADIVEYQTINKLGGENNHWQVIARAAIARATNA
jgi:hypothetical protein